MSELVKLIGAMAERGWVYSDSSTYDSLVFIQDGNKIKQFHSWDEVAAFVEGEK